MRIAAILLLAALLLAVPLAAQAIPPGAFAQMWWASQIDVPAWELSLSVGWASYTTAYWQVQYVNANQLSIDYGDGDSVVVTGSGTVSNYFPSIGSYTVRIRGAATGISVMPISNNSRRFLDSAAPILGIIGLTSVANLFDNNSLEAVSYATNLFTDPSCANITRADYAFYNNINSPGPFPDMTPLCNLTNLNYAWYHCEAMTAAPALCPTANIVNLESAWRNCFAVTSLPAINGYTNVVNLKNTYYECFAAKDFPAVNALVNMSGADALWGTWYNTKGATNYPEVSNIVKATALVDTWRYGGSPGCKYPRVDSLTNVTTMRGAWQGCTNMTDAPEFVFTNPVLTIVSNAFFGCYSVTNNLPDFWNTNKFPAITAAGHGEVFNGCTGAANWSWITNNLDGTWW